MSSTPSVSPASPDLGDRSVPKNLRERWPTLIALPTLVALLGAASLTPLLSVFLDESFGLSGGRGAPWTWALAGIGLLGFWSAKAVGARGLSSRNAASILLVLGLVVALAWFSLEPRYDLLPLLRDPVSLVQENGYLIVPLFLALGAWYQGIRYDYDSGLFSPEEIRGNVQRSWALIASSIVLSALIGGDAGGAGISASAIAVPAAMACSAGAVAAAETSNTRWLASRRGSSAPGWDRWARLFGGIVIVSLIVTLIAAVLLGPDALAFIKDGLRSAFYAAGTVIYWILFGIVYVLYWIYRFVAWIMNSLFGDLLPAMEPPQMEPQGQPARPELEEQASEPFAHATLLRWVALGVALLIVAVILFQLGRARRKEDENPDVDEERQSIFSAKLARQQLRDLFKRKPRAKKPRRLDLGTPPSSVRESMLYLQVLATRQHVGREPDETPADFTQRLVELWPSLADSLDVLRDQYEGVRYGETPDDRAAVLDAWQHIWSTRKDAPVPPESSG